MTPDVQAAADPRRVRPYLRQAAIHLRAQSRLETDPVIARTDQAVANWLDNVARDSAHTARPDLRDAEAVADAILDTPIDAIPTPAGRQLVDDYRAHRTQQREHNAGSCPDCGQTVYLEAGRIGWHPSGEDGNLTTCPGSGRRPKANADA